MKVLLFTIWFIAFMAISTICLGMISDADSIANIVGLIVLILCAIGSYETRCLTKFIKSNNK